MVVVHLNRAAFVRLYQICCTIYVLFNRLSLHSRPESWDLLAVVFHLNRDDFVRLYQIYCTICVLFCTSNGGETTGVQL